MGKLIVWNIATLDGYFEGPQPWDLAMHQTVWGPELEKLSLAQHRDAEALIFGRRTYEGMAAHWTAATGPIADDMNGLRKYVVSKTLRETNWNNSRIIAGDVVSEIAGLKSAAAKNLYVFGSADLLSTLLPAGLVDQYRLCIAPVLLGRGNPLFKPADKTIPLTLEKSQPLQNGGIVLYYGVGTPA